LRCKKYERRLEIYFVILKLGARETRPPVKLRVTRRAKGDGGEELSFDGGWRAKSGQTA